MYWGKEGDFTTYENVISIIYNGAIATGKVYTQKERTGKKVIEASGAQPRSAIRYLKYRALK